jgi:hypothetical protein
MSQSGFIAAMLLAAFVLWLAVNDRLSAYTAVLWGDTAQPKPSGNITTPSGVIGPAPAGGAPATGSPGGLLPDGAPSIPGIGGGGGIGGLLENAGKVAGLLEFLP